MTEVRFSKTNDEAHPPTKATDGSAGLDLYAATPAIIPYSKGVTYLSVGVSMEIPKGYAGIIVPRSSLHKRGLELANTIGVIDSDYRGDIKLPLTAIQREHTWDTGDIFVEQGDRLAQLLIISVLDVTLVESATLSNTERGHGGFGSTG